MTQSDHGGRTCLYEGIQGVDVFEVTEAVITLAYAGDVDVTNTPWDDRAGKTD